MPTSIAGTVTTVGIEGAEVEAGLDPGLLIESLVKENK